MFGVVVDIMDIMSGVRGRGGGWGAAVVYFVFGKDR
jgi:hypothetical protein